MPDASIAMMPSDNWLIFGILERMNDISGYDISVIFIFRFLKSDGHICPQVQKNRVSVQPILNSNGQYKFTGNINILFTTRLCDMCNMEKYTIFEKTPLNSCMIENGGFEKPLALSCSV